MKKKSVVIFTIITTLFLCNNVSAVDTPIVPSDVKVNPIEVPADAVSSADEAKAKCPGVCTNLVWNGQWTTTVFGKMSVCGTTVGVDVPIGPIWFNDDAKGKCQPQISKVTWSGQWTTKEPGGKAVCICTPPTPLAD